MSTPPSKVKPPTLRRRRTPISTFRLTVMRSLRASWVKWELERTRRKYLREEQRQILLRQEMDSSLLRLKELQQRGTQLLHRQAEMQQSLLWHETQVNSLRTGVQP